VASPEVHPSLSGSNKTPRFTERRAPRFAVIPSPKSGDILPIAASSTAHLPELLRLSILVTGEQSVCQAGVQAQLRNPRRREGNLGLPRVSLKTKPASAPVESSGSMPKPGVLFTSRTTMQRAPPGFSAAHGRFSKPPRDEGTAYPLQQFWVIPVVSPYPPRVNPIESLLFLEFTEHVQKKLANVGAQQLN
jgi:hypothetical protein